MYLLVLYFPLASTIILYSCGRFLGNRGAILFSISNILYSFSISLFIFFEIILSESICWISLMKWVDCGFFFIEWSFLFDSLTSIMLIIVTFISLLVQIYSTSYMEHDPHLIRFMATLSLFTFFMLILVTSKNFIQLFLGWEGVGLASFLLISFWFTREKALKSALKAVIVNRIGDIAFLIGIGFIFLFFKSFDFAFIFALTPLKKDIVFNFYGKDLNVILLIGIFLLIGVIGKSAQIGLHTWLPDAMEGPTPVSALIHAATMVTAGVFLLLRCSPLFNQSSSLLTTIAVIGAFTSFFAGLVGCFQNDLKRVIAYSTCSQLGYMIFSYGLSNFYGSLFHLSNHAFFKALLFLSAGSIIHAIRDEQDMRKMGGLIQIMPITYASFLIGTLAIIGFPFLTSFYSKDLILEFAFCRYSLNGLFIFWIGTISACLTSFYSFRLLYFVFYSKYNGPRAVIFGIKESNTIILIVLVILSICSIFIGYCGKEIFFGIGSITLNNSLYQTINSIEDIEFIPVSIKWIPLICSFFGGFISVISYKILKGIFYSLLIKKFFLISQSSYFNVIYSLFFFMNRKWCIDFFYNYFFVKSILSFGYKTSFKVIDRGLVEIYGPLGFVRFFNKIGILISGFHIGSVADLLEKIFYGLTVSGFIMLVFGMG